MVGCGWRGEGTAIQLHIAHQLVSKATKDAINWFSDFLVSCGAFVVYDRFPRRDRRSKLCKQRNLPTRQQTPDL